MPRIKGIVHEYPQQLKIKSHPTIAILLLLGFVFRFFLMRYRFAVTFDEVNYLKLGVSGYLNGLGDLMHTYWSPFLPFLISLFSPLFHDYELAARLVSIIAGTALIIPVYYLGRLVYDETVGVLAAGFVALFPPLAFQSTEILTEPLLMLLAASAVLFGAYMLKRYSVAFAIPTGLCCGLLYLTHPTGFGFLVVIGFWIVLGSFSKLFLIRPLRIVWLAAPFLICFLLVSFPYLLFLKDASGTWTLSAKGAANQQLEAHVPGDTDPFRSFDPVHKSVPIDQIYHQGDFLQATNGGSKQISEVHVGSFLLKYLKNVYVMLQRGIPNLLTTIPLLLVGVGLFGGPWKPQQGKLILFLLSFIVFFWFVLIPAFHINERYLTPLWPICALFVAFGAVRVHSWLSGYMPLVTFSKRWKLKPANMASTLILSVFLLLVFLPELGAVVTRDANSADVLADPVDQKRAGAWLKENASEPVVIMSRNHAVDVYAGNYDIKKSVTIPTSSIKHVLEYAKLRGVNYLVINERYMSLYPDLRPLLESDGGLPGLDLIYDDRDPSGLVTKIYKLDEVSN